MEPYLSVIIGTRNDDYAGGMLRRLAVFIETFMDQADRYRLPSEIILVEWNPPACRVSLKEAVRWPKRSGWCSVCGDFTLMSRRLYFAARGLPEEEDYHSAHFDSIFCYLAYRAGAREHVLEDKLAIYHVNHPTSSWETRLSWLARIIHVGCVEYGCLPCGVFRKPIVAKQSVSPTSSDCRT